MVLQQRFRTYQNRPMDEETINMMAAGDDRDDGNTTRGLLMKVFFFFLLLLSFLSFPLFSSPNQPNPLK